MPSPDGKPDQPKPGQQKFGAQYKLIGKDYTTPDLYAKVTGKAKYAEDFRAEGMLFCKLLLSPVPHGRVKHLDLSKALAMPGVKAILTQDDLPAPADSVTDLGVVIKANKQGEKALTMEPLYQGEPILAVAAVDGIDGVRLHDLRHSCASLAISAGANVKVVQRLLGHKTAVLTLDRYGHLFPDHLDAVADAFDVAAATTAGGLRAIGNLKVIATDGNTL